MNRRDFLRSIGLATAAMAVSPSALLPAPPEFYDGYPPLRFSGLHGSQTVEAFAGNVSWAVLWEDAEREDLTFWSYRMRIDRSDICRAGDLGGFLDAKIKNLLLTAANAMDGVAAHAAQGMVNNAKFEQEANPDYDPSKPTYWEDADGDEHWNYETISTDRPILHKVKRVKLVAWDDIHLGKSEGKGMERQFRGGPLWDVQYPYQPSFDAQEIKEKAKADLSLWIPGLRCV